MADAVCGSIPGQYQQLNNKGSGYRQRGPHDSLFLRQKCKIAGFGSYHRMGTSIRAFAIFFPDRLPVTLPLMLKKRKRFNLTVASIPSMRERFHVRDRFAKLRPRTNRVRSACPPERRPGRKELPERIA